MAVTIDIDPGSGFCFGVTTAISKAEDELRRAGRLYCLGDIVHNSDEVERLQRRGLVTITHSQMERLHDVKVLLRAHGEPPSTYATACANGIEIIDATCPVVLKLQQRIKEACARPDAPQIVIYGKNGHAEVNGLVGQTGGSAIVVEDDDDLDRVDPGRDTFVYSQTTKSVEGFDHIVSLLAARMAPGVRLQKFDTICRSVSGRVGRLKAFAADHDVVLFVAGTKSSNGRILYNHCAGVNSRCHLVANATHVQPEWFDGARTIGICGATSTPRWLMEQVRDRVAAITRDISL